MSAFDEVTGEEVVGSDFAADSPAPGGSSVGGELGRPRKSVNRDPEPRHWYLERKGKFRSEKVETIDVLDAIVEEVKCSIDTARKLVEADLVRLADHQEVPKWTGHYVEPGSLAILYKAQGAVRLDDSGDDDDLWLDEDGRALPIQECEAWRAKCLDGSFASMKSSDGFPVFRRWSNSKYVSPRGAPACLLFLPRVVNPSVYDRPNRIVVVEGEKKAILLAEHGIAAVSISGVSSWSYRPDRARAATAGESAAPTLAPALTELLTELGCEEVVIAFDSPDIYGDALGGNDEVVREAGKLAAALKVAGYKAGWLVLPRPTDSTKWGADDWIVSHRAERIDKYDVLTPDEYCSAFETGGERVFALLRLLVARASALKRLGQASGSAGAQVKSLVKALKLANEDAVLEALEEVLLVLPEPWLRSWLEAHGATYSYRHQSLVIDGVVKPIDGVLERLHLDSFEGPRFHDKTISAALGQWMEEQDSVAVKALCAKLAYDSTASGSSVERFVTACTGKADRVDVEVLRHFVWQVKRKLNSLPVDHHLMPILYRERAPGSKGQGGGKTTAVARLLAPLAEVVTNVADLREAVDPRGLKRYTRSFVAVVDEMARGETANTDALKWLVTSEMMSWRVLGTNKDAHGVNRATFIGTANKNLTDLIYDPTGVRRFYQIECLEKLNWDVINTVDYLMLWRSVDEHGPAPILTVKAELEARQEAWTPKDALEEWLAEVERRPDYDKKTWPTSRVLHQQFCDWLRRTGRPAWSETKFGRRMKVLLTAGEQDRGERGQIYAVFPAGELTCLLS